MCSNFHIEGIMKLTFQALALRQDEGVLTLLVKMLTWDLNNQDSIINPLSIYEYLIIKNVNLDKCLSHK